MRRAERLFRLVQELRSRDISRAEDLASHFEISVRTIYRDIAHLQASGLPIEGAAGIGYLLRPGFDLPAMTFTYEQLDALAVGLAFVETAGDTSLAEAARDARAKIQASLPDSKNRDLQQAPFFVARRDGRASPLTKQVRIAVREKKKIQLRYRDGKGSITDRCVWPLAIWSFTDGWLFAAWCELRRDFRAFRIDRIIGLRSTGDRFGDDSDKNLEAYKDARKIPRLTRV